MSDEPIRPGEIVNVVIKGVRNVGHPSDQLRKIVDEHGDTYPMPPQAAITRVAPSLWPPCTGDLWRDGHEALWLACEMNGDPGALRMVCANTGETQSPEHLLKSGSVEIVHRERDMPPF